MGRDQGVEGPEEVEAGMVGRGWLKGFLSILILTVLMGGDAGAATLNVPVSYLTIQAAVDAALDGDTINVSAGTYNENVDITKSVNLVGAGMASTIVHAANSNDHVFFINANWVNISGFTVTGATGSWVTGVHIHESNYSKIENINSTNNDNGIVLWLSSHNTIVNNTVSGISNFGINVVNQSNNNTVADNTVTTSNDSGIRVQDSCTYNLIRNNTVYSNDRAGISLKNYASYNTIEGNTVTNNPRGIELHGSSCNYNTISNNDVNSNNDTGIILDSANYNTLKDNTVRLNNNSGIFVLNSSRNNTIEGNDVKYNAIGIDIRDSSGLNTVIDNGVISNDLCGISLKNSDNNTVKDNLAAENGKCGILLREGSDYNIITNNNASQNDYDGIKLNESNYNTISNNIMNSNNLSGLKLKTSAHFNTIIDNIANNNGDKGIYLVSSNYNTLINNTANENIDHGFQLNGSSYNNLTDNIAVGNGWCGYLLLADYGGIPRYNRLVDNYAAYNGINGMTSIWAEYNQFINNTAVYNNWSGIGFDGTWYNGNTNHSLISGNNVSYNNKSGISIYKSGNNTIKDNIANFNNVTGILLSYSSNSRVENVICANNTIGIVIINNSNFNNLTNNDALNNGIGIVIRDSSYNLVKDNTANNNNNIPEEVPGIIVDAPSSGILVGWSNFTFTMGNTLSNNEVGISQYYSFNNSVIQNHAFANQYGILNFNSPGSSSEHTIYNNLLNNTNNAIFGGTVYPNYWNTTKQSGTNIIGGPYLGGNFWAKPDGTGFSETCADGDGDGICDTYYNLTSGNVDFLPLTLHATSAPGVGGGGFAFNISGNVSILWNISYSNITKRSYFGDLTGDGIMDIVELTGGDYTYAEIVALRGIDGTLLWNHTLHGNAFPHEFYLVDMTGDGIDDVLFSDGNNPIILALNGSSGSLLWMVNVSNLSGADSFYSAVTPDLDGDKVPDVVAFSNTNTSDYIIYGIKGTNGTILWQRSIGAWPVFVPIYGIKNISGDLTGDGREDVVISYTNYSASNDVVMLLSGATGSTLWNRTVPVSGYVYHFYSITDDVNGDSTPDLMEVGSSVTLISGASGSAIYTVNGTQASGCIRDYTGDGVCDFITFSNGTVYFRSGSNGSALWSWWVGDYYMYPCVMCSSGGVVSLVNTTAGIQQILKLNFTSGARAWNVTFNLSSLGVYDLMCDPAGDLDGDGRFDVVVHEMTSGRYTAAINGAAGTLFWEESNRSVTFIGDFDGDGSGDAYAGINGTEVWGYYGDVMGYRSAEVWRGGDRAFIFNYTSWENVTLQERGGESYYGHYSKYNRDMGVDLTGDNRTEVILILNPDREYSSLLVISAGNLTLPGIDTVPPVLTFVDPTPFNGTVTQGRYIFINVTSNESLSSASLYLYLWHDGRWEFPTDVPMPMPMNGSGTTWYLNLTAETHDLVLRYWVEGRDPSGNAGQTETRYATIAGHAPAILAQGPPGAVPMGSTAPIGVFIQEASPDTLRIFRNGTLVNQTSYQGFVSFNVSVNTSLAGTWNYTIWANDTYGNINTTEVLVTVDATPPALTFVDPTPANATNSSSTQETINVTSDEALKNATFHFQAFFGTLWGKVNESGFFPGEVGMLPMQRVSDTNWLFTYPLSSDLVMRYWVNGTDLSGYWNITETRYLTITGHAPILEAHGPPGAVLQGEPATLGLTILEAAPDTLKVFLNGTLVNQTSYPGFVPFNLTANTSLPGTWNYTFWANDTLGNSNSTSILVEVTPVVEVTGCTLITTPGYYKLTQDINDSSVTCMTIKSSNVHFDGQGHTIDGTKSGGTMGVYAFPATGTLTDVHVRNLTLSDWHSAAIRFSQVENGSIANVTATSSWDDGISLDSSDGTKVTGNNASYNGRYGIYVGYSDGVTISNNLVNFNTMRGIVLQTSTRATVKENTLKENHLQDIYLMESTDAACNHIFENNTGSGDRPIRYFNHSVNLQDETFSELLLCNADNSNITNLTIQGSATWNNNGLYMRGTDNSILVDINSSGNQYGIRMENSSWNRLEDIVAESSGASGIYIYSSRDNILDNCTVTGSGAEGIFLDWADNTVINNSLITNNSNAGIHLNGGGANRIQNSNISYNNGALEYAGLYLFSSDDNTFVKNYISNNPRYGVMLSVSDNNTFKDNQIVYNCGGEDGVYLTTSYNNTFLDNNISHNTGIGIEIYSSDSNILSGGAVTDNGGGVGISIYTSSYITVKGIDIRNNGNYGIYDIGSGEVFSYQTFSNNNISGSTHCIYLDSEDSSVITGNRIWNCSYGISLFGYLYNITIYDNFLNNTNNTDVSGGTSNAWNTSKQNVTNIVGGPYLGGNFWARPDGTGFSQVCNDWDRDGICDSNRTVAYDNVDFLPLAAEVGQDVTPPVLKTLPPTPKNGSLIGVDWVFVNLSSDEPLREAWIELWNASGFMANLTTSNTSSTNWYRNLTSLADGVYQGQGWARDLKGNLGKTPWFTFTVDTSLLTVTIHTPREGRYYNTSNVTLNVTTNRETHTLWYSLDSGANQTLGSNLTGTTATLANLTDGTHNLTVYANDTNSVNASTTVTFTVDTRAPVLGFEFPTPPPGANRPTARHILVNVSANETLKRAVLVVNGTEYPMWRVQTGSWFNSPYQWAMRKGMHSRIDLGSSLGGLPSRRLVGMAQIKAGCNDGETLDGLIEFWNDTSGQWEHLTHFARAGCGANISFKPVNTSMVRLTMTGGGGKDHQISWSCCGSEGWRVLEIIPLEGPGRDNWIGAVRNLQAGTYFYNVTGYDLAGNSNTTETRNITLGSPDLAIRLEVPSQYLTLNQEVNLTLTVFNKGNKESPSTTVNFTEEKRLWWWNMELLQYNDTITIPALAPGGNYTVNLTYKPTTASWHLLTVLVDPGDEITEAGEDNNKDSKWVHIGGVDLQVEVLAPDIFMPGQNLTYRVRVSNRGTRDVQENTTVNVTVNGVSTEFVLEPLRAWGRRIVHTATLAMPPGGLNVTAIVDQEDNISETREDNNNHTKRIRAVEYRLDNLRVRTPWYKVFEGNYFYVGTSFHANIPGFVNATIQLKDGLELAPWERESKRIWAWNSWWNSVWWRVKAEDAGNYSFNITLTAFDKTNHTNGSVVVRTQTVIVKVTNSTLLNGSSSTNLTFKRFNITTYEEEIYIDISAGAEGRFLMGLEWLVGYPHGCPEQTMSPTQAAYRVYKYYQKFDYSKFLEQKSTLETKVDSGVSRMEPTGDNGQTPDGCFGWGTRGTDSSRCTLFYTYYPFFTISEIFKDSNFTFVMNKSNISFENVSRWLIGKQNKDNTSRYHGCWEPGGYINGRIGTTAFIMRALGNMQYFWNYTAVNPKLFENYTDVMRLVNSSLANATQCLLRTQINSSQDNGSWNAHGDTSGPDTFTTALAVLGLNATGNTSGEVTDAIHRAATWLLNNTEADGSWRMFPGHSSSSYSWLGGQSESTAYALMALYTAGYNSTNSRQVYGGLNYLIGTYESQGRWGSTKQTKAVVKALTDIQFWMEINMLIDIGIYSENGTLVFRETYNMTNNATNNRTFLNASVLSQLGYGNLTMNITALGNGSILVAVDTKQVVPKKQALLMVPAEFIDPIAENFSITLEVLESDVKDGDTVTVNATIYNKDNTSDLYVMIMEVPLSENVSFVNTTDPYYSNGTDNHTLTWMFNETEEKVYIYPGSYDEIAVKKGSSRSHYFKMKVEGSGQRTIEASVYPMYNPTYFAYGNISFDVKGYGNATFNPINGTNESVVSATVTLGSHTLTGTSPEFREVEGNYTLNVSAAGFRDVLANLTVSPGDDSDYTVRLYEALEEPALVMTAGSIRPLSLSQAQGEYLKEYNYTIYSTGGTATVAMDIPENYELTGTAQDGSSIDPILSNNRSQGTVYVSVELTGDSVITFTFRQTAFEQAMEAGQTYVFNESVNDTKSVLVITSANNVYATIKQEFSTNSTEFNATDLNQTIYDQNTTGLNLYQRLTALGANASTDFYWIYFKFFYTTEDLDMNGDGDAEDQGDINASSLKLYWFNGSTWKVVQEGADYRNESGPYVYGAGVDTTGRYVWSNITSFSVYGIGGGIITSTGDTGEPSPSGGGGGGGGAGSETEVSKRALEVRAGQPWQVTFTEAENPYLEALELLTGSDIFNAEIKVDYSTQKPYPTMPDPEGRAYAYLKFKPSSTLTSGLVEATIRFKVSTTWLKENDVDPATVVLNRLLSSNQYQVLSTEETGRDSDYVYFTATTPGFSYFVITGTAGSGYKEPAAEEPPGTEAPPATTAPPVETEKPVVTEGPKKTEAPPRVTPAAPVTTEEEAGTSKGLIVVVVVALLVAIVALWKKEEILERFK